MDPPVGQSALPASLAVVLVTLAFLAGLSAPARAASPEDDACRDWAKQQTPEEQVREGNEVQASEDVDKDGCIGVLATPGSSGPVDGAQEDGGVAELAQAEGSGQAADAANTVPSSPAPEATGSMDETGEASGLTGMVLDFFKGILEWVWDNTIGWALENMAEAFHSNALSLPTLGGRGELLAFYTGAVERLRPAILVGILILGCLMMVRSDNYDLAYAGFQGLPKLMGVAMAMAFLPQFMGELSRITAGITGAFFPGGGSLGSAGQELFKAAIGNMALANFLNLILLVAAAWGGMLVIAVSLLKSILYVMLYISGPFALTASLMPGLSSLAGSWFRGVLACAAIPALWSIQLAIGTFAVRSPEAIFGPGTGALGFISESAVTSIAAILILWVMYKTPFKVIEWAFNVHLPGRGGLVGLAKAGAALAIAVPAKTAIASATKSLLSRSTGGAAGGAAGGASVSKMAGDKSSQPAQKGMPGKEGAQAARKIQQVQHQGQQARKAENVGRAHFKYTRQRDRDQEHKEPFMQDRPRRSGAPGMGARSGDRSGKKG
ncbi:MAG: type IV secretion system protein [Actinomycetota bacterium]|nr:type IV secretion system protein [Actinomycetota bacterium]